MQLRYVDLEFTARQLTNQPQAQPIPPMENTKTFLTRIIEKVLVSKKDVRKEWNNIKSERLKLVQRLNKANQAIKFGVSKKKVYEEADKS